MSLIEKALKANITLVFSLSLVETSQKQLVSMTLLMQGINRIQYGTSVGHLQQSSTYITRGAEKTSSLREQRRLITAKLIVI